MSGVIAMMVAAGGGDTNITLIDGFVPNGGAGSRTSTYRIGSDGNVYHGENGVFTLSYQWCKLPGVSTNYEVRADVDTGSLSSGTTGSWTVPSGNLDWAVQDTLNDGTAVEATITVKIRNATTQVELDSASITMSANRTS